jgi:hypothetical protein
MSDKCIDPDLGRLIHAYEIDGLGEEARLRFERHLMVCPSCFGKVKSLAEASRVMCRSARVRAMVENYDQDSERSFSLTKKLRQWLWPPTPLVFRPGVIYAIVGILLLFLIISLPAYFETPDSIRTVQTIRLLPTRGLDDNTLYKDSKSEGLIIFGVPEANYGEEYSVLIELSGADKTLYREDRAAVDQNGLGKVVIPLAKMAIGDYHLRILEKGSENPIAVVEYRFRIAKEEVD